MNKLTAAYFSDDVVALNPDVFSDGERLSVAVSGGAATRDAEEMFITLFEMVSCEDLVREYQFDESRRWRFDFAHFETRIAIEIDGGVWTAGRHTRGQGYINDCQKMNEAAAQGWRVFRFPAHTLSLANAELVAAAIEEALGPSMEDER